MADKPLRLMISFKVEEKWILDEINKHSGKGNWVKDILAEEIRSQRKGVQDDSERPCGIIEDLL